MNTGARASHSYRIGVDTGGTFTDVVVGGSESTLAVGKALTTRERISRGILAALAVSAEEVRVPVRELLGSTDLFIYGSTRATNAIIEGKTARTALLVTQGFPDILVRREGGKLNPWDFSERFPEPYVPRRLTFEVHERMSAEGQIVLPLNVQRAQQLAGRLKALNVEAVAVCFLWSVANGKHELMIGEILREVLPGIPYTLSHQLNPIVREYRRASSTAIDASLKPLMQEHLREMESDLRAAGLKGELLPATSLGGVLHVEEVIARPIHMVRSGPALAPVLGRELGRIEAGASDVIVCDTGGTSFDVSLVRDGRLVFTRDTWLGGRYVGHLTGLSSVDARSIGAGGGSIARVDAGGLLCVGPESAGAEPGPACYGRGGAWATVTDAALLLGYLDPACFLGGRMSLDAQAARTAIGALSARLGGDLEATAAGIVTLAGEHMVQAIKEITINEGVDPRESLLIAGGGAAGINIVPIARELGCQRVLVPRLAGALSACGAQYTDVISEASANVTTPSSSFDFAAVNLALDGIEQKLSAFEAQIRARGTQAGRIDLFVEARYLNQVWELEIPLKSRRVRTEQELAKAIGDFHAAHESIFAVKEVGQEVEFVQWKGRLTAGLPKPTLNASAARSHETDLVQPKRRTRAYFSECGTVDIGNYLGRDLYAGAVVTGPAIIHEPTSTIVVYPRSRAVVTDSGNYMLTVEAT